MAVRPRPSCRKQTGKRRRTARTSLSPTWRRPESDTETDARAGGRCQNLARHLPLGFLGKVQPAAMHRNQHVGVELADLADDLRKIIRRRRPEMKAAHDRMDLL